MSTCSLLYTSPPIPRQLGARSSVKRLLRPGRWVRRPRAFRPQHLFLARVWQSGSPWRAGQCQFLSALDVRSGARAHALFLSTPHRSQPSLMTSGASLQVLPLLLAHNQLSTTVPRTMRITKVTMCQHPSFLGPQIRFLRRANVAPALATVS